MEHIVERARFRLWLRSGYGRTSPLMGLSMRVLDGTARGLHVGASAIHVGCEGHCARLKGREGGERA